jgi:hypothetical protein
MIVIERNERVRHRDEQVEFFGKSAGWTLTSFVLFGLMLISSAAGSDSAPNNQTKSKFLTNFAEFTEWPETAFTNEAEPLLIGIPGRNPFGKELEKLADGVVKGRHMRVLRFRKVEEIKTCHILYISKSEEPRLDRILRELKERPVLTVSEIENSAKRGVMIEMKTENGKIRLAINLECAKAAHLTLKSKLLRLGEIVESGNK